MFERLHAIFGRQLADAIGDASVAGVRAEWADALAGLSGDEIGRGVQACRSARWAPNLPGFMLLCRPGLDPDAAWSEASRGLQARSAGKPFTWTHPAVYWAAIEMAHEVGAGDLKACRSRWEAELAAQWRRGEWPDVPPPRRALPPPEMGPAVPIPLRVRQIVQRAQRRSGDDPRDWARRLRQREQAGERLTQFQRDAWRETLKGRE